LGSVSVLQDNHCLADLKSTVALANLQESGLKNHQIWLKSILVFVSSFVSFYNTFITWRTSETKYNIDERLPNFIIGAFANNHSPSIKPKPPYVFYMVLYIGFLILLFNLVSSFINDSLVIGEM